MDYLELGISLLHVLIRVMRWGTVSKFEVGTGNESFTFLDRLAKENGWSHCYTRQVYLEYLKFMYLAASSNTTVTPSEDVDQVWHMHLCYTRSYWHDLCRDVLGKDIHHGPTQGGAVERAKYDACYETTLHLYEETFGEPAPVSIWPNLRERFNTKNEYLRVNRRHTFVYSKKTCGLGLLGIGAILLAGCSQTVGRSFQKDPVGSILIAAVCLYVGYRILRWLIKHGGNGGGCSSGCSNSCGGDSGCGGGCGGD